MWGCEPMRLFRHPQHGLFLLLTAVLLGACSTKEPVAYTPPDQDESFERAELQARELVQAPAEQVVFVPAAPETYIVQKGDTLWDISTQFLKSPWFWPEIWFKNPQIENPHLIYPGDELAIIYVGGQPRISLVRRADGSYVEPPPLPTGMKVVKLSPRIRAEPIDAAIPSIPIEAIRQLLIRPLIIEEEFLASSPYIVSSKDEHLIASSNDEIYIRGLDNENVGSGRYQIFRPNRRMRDPVSNEVLGYEALYVGEAKLIRKGEPATARILRAKREILLDDRLLPMTNEDIQSDFFPKPPPFPVEGRVVSLFDAISQTGQYQVIAVNVGQRDNIEMGHLLQINRQGRVVRDLNEKDPDFRIQLPDERAALAMVIKSFDRLSYALIMEVDVPVKVNDFVLSPR